MDRGAPNGMTIEYPALIAGLETQNQFNAVHIALESTMTPLEFASIARHSDAGDLPPQTQVWLDRWRRHCPSLVTSPQPFVRDVIDHGLTWLRAPETGSGSKRILIAFCGNSDRLTVPLPVALQAIPADQWDVLRVTRNSFYRPVTELRDSKSRLDADPPANQSELRTSYMRPGTEITDLHALDAALRSELRGIEPKRFTCLGASSGARPAILMALRMGATRCICLGGQYPDEWMPLLPALAGAAYRTRAPWPAFVYVFGADNAADSANAERLQALFGGELLSLVGMKTHSVLNGLLQQGELLSVLNPLLLGE